MVLVSVEVNELRVQGMPGSVGRHAWLRELVFWEDEDAEVAKHECSVPERGEAIRVEAASVPLPVL